MEVLRFPLVFWSVCFTFVLLLCMWESRNAAFLYGFMFFLDTAWFYPNISC